jgi:hypothetical protein
MASVGINEIASHRIRKSHAQIAIEVDIGCNTAFEKLMRWAP